MTPETHARLIVIGGPTGAGKSAAALKFATMYGGEIVGADSVQIYRGFDIGSAKPTPEEMALVPHHMIDVADPDEDFSAGRYQKEARAVIQDVEKRSARPVVAGGTGFYIKALLEGLFEGPAKNVEIRARLQAMESEEPGVLHRYLTQVDPSTAQRLHPNDTVRIVRALEVYEITGKSLSWWHERHSSKPWRPAIYIVVDPGEPELSRRLESRVEQMLRDGFVEEVEALLDKWPETCKPFSTVGYKQVVQYLKGGLSKKDLPEAILRAHRRYVKQQRTWFRRKGIHLPNSEATLQYLRDELKLH